MPETTPPVLDEGFPAATQEAWLALVQRTLKGEPFETLVSRTADGLEIRPLYTADDAEGRLVARTPSVQQAAPDSAWDVRSMVAHPDASVANAQVLEDLAGGANSVLLRIAQDGTPGCALADAAGLASVLDGVVLEAATVAFDAGWAGPSAATWMADAAKGSPTARFALHLDPLSRFAATGSSPGPVEDHIAAAALRACEVAPIYPRASLFLATGQAVHEAGGSEAQELGFMAASLVAYVRALEAAGMAPADGLGKIVAGVATDGDYFISIAKLRAARLICRRIGQATGAVEADGGPTSIEARSSRRMLARVDAWTNLLRLTAAGFAAAAGGADAVVLAPFTDPVGPPTTMARRQARNTQLLLMQESHIGRVADPAAGSWYVESLTDRLARQGWAVFQAIERQGGLVAALTSGFIAANVEGARAALQAAAERRGVLGVSKYPNPEERPAPIDTTAATGVSSLDVRLPGPDSACPPLAPIRLAAPFEDFDGALT